MLYAHSLNDAVASLFFHAHLWDFVPPIEIIFIDVRTCLHTCFWCLFLPVLFSFLYASLKCFNPVLIILGENVYGRGPHYHKKCCVWYGKCKKACITGNQRNMYQRGIPPLQERELTTHMCIEGCTGWSPPMKIICMGGNKPYKTVYNTILLVELR